MAKKFPFTKTFPNTGPIYSGLSDASRYLKSRGFSIGKMEQGQPTAIVKGVWRGIQNWSYLLEVEKKAVDGVMESNDFEHGEVVVRLKKKP